MNELDQEEREVLKAFETGKTSSRPDAERIRKRHQGYAAAMFKKDARINIRITARDLRCLKKEPWLKAFPTRH